MVLKKFIANWSESLWRHLKPTHILKSIKDNYRMLLDELGVLDCYDAPAACATIGGQLTPIEIPGSNILSGESISGVSSYPDGYGFAITNLPSDIVAISVNPSSTEVWLVGTDFIVVGSIVFFNKDPRNVLIPGIVNGEERFYGVASRTRCYKLRHVDLVDRNRGCSDNRLTVACAHNSREASLLGGVSLDRLTLPACGVADYRPISVDQQWTEGDYNLTQSCDGSLVRSKKTVERLLYASAGGYSWLINNNPGSSIIGPLSELFPELNSKSIDLNLAVNELRRRGYVSIEAVNDLSDDSTELLQEMTPAFGGVTHFQRLAVYNGDDIPLLSSNSSINVSYIYLVYCGSSMNNEHLSVFPGITLDNMVDSVINISGGLAKSSQSIDGRYIVDNSACLGRSMRTGDRLIGVLLCGGGNTPDTCSILKYIPVTNFKISIGCCIAVETLQRTE